MGNRVGHVLQPIPRFIRINEKRANMGTLDTCDNSDRTRDPMHILYFKTILKLYEPSSLILFKAFTRANLL